MKVNLVGIEPHEDRLALLQALILPKRDLVVSTRFLVGFPPPEAKQLRLGAA